MTNSKNFIILIQSLAVHIWTPCELDGDYAWLLIMLINLIILMLIKNRCNREEKERERDWEQAIMHYYNTVTSKISNVVIFANYIFSAYILHKAKIEQYFIIFVITRK